MPRIGFGCCGVAGATFSPFSRKNHERLTGPKSPEHIAQGWRLRTTLLQCVKGNRLQGSLNMRAIMELDRKERASGRAVSFFPITERWTSRQTRKEWGFPSLSAGIWGGRVEGINHRWSECGLNSTGTISRRRATATCLRRAGSRKEPGRAGGAGNRSLGLQKPLIVKTDKLILTDDNMIVQQDIHQFAGFFDSFGEIDV